MTKKLLLSTISLALLASVASADTVTGFNAITVNNPDLDHVSLTSLTYNTVTYSSSQFIYGTTLRYYWNGTINQVWASGSPQPGDLVGAGGGTANAANVAPYADNNIWSTTPFPGSGASDIASLDGLPYLTTMFASPVSTIFCFERGGNDTGNIQPILVGGGLGAPLTLTANSAPYLNTGVGVASVGTQNAFGFVYESTVPIQGIQINAPGFDALSILTIAPAPEPSTLALAGVGSSATLLIFRRRGQRVG